MKVIEVLGKSTRGLRKIFVILYPDMIHAMHYLVRTRKKTVPFWLKNGHHTSRWLRSDVEFHGKVSLADICKTDQNTIKLQSSTIEKTKVAKLLITMESGNISGFRGRILEDIAVDDIPNHVTYDDSLDKKNRWRSEREDPGSNPALTTGIFLSKKFIPHLLFS
ncbi:hypothetical protein DPMN_143203 [Dreissena polymorpha]|uniref:Uncharacterized protein n=1 Tax=Dreissena polymorpha TaxID=45954 RepID=A0A9D4GIQ2_DREPO|nr:hypothetical protein DPMN_143203 [Dreissena polymorpha]